MISTMTAGQRTRRARRIQIQPTSDINLSYGIASEGRGVRKFEGLALDISESGAQFVGRTPGAAWIGDLIEGRARLAVEIKLPSRRFRLEAKPCWIRSTAGENSTRRLGTGLHTFGVRFVGLDRKVKKELGLALIRDQIRCGRVIDEVGFLGG